MIMRHVFSAVLLAASAVSAAEMPLKVSDLVTGPPTHVRVSNTSTQPITAWALAATSRSANGTTHREVYTTDGYLSEVTHGLPGAEARLERLMPGESRQLPLDPLPAGSTVEAIAVILDDGTAMGDQELLGQIFAKRVKERDALKSVVDAFKEVLPAKRGAEAIAALKQRFTALAQQSDAVPSRAALDAVQQFERQAAAADVDPALQNYAGFVQKQYDLAAKHATRKGAM
jgi:hypothetical protein